MARKHSSFDYKMLVRFMLPNGILDYFEVTKIEEEVTDEKDETGPSSVSCTSTLTNVTCEM